MTLIDTIEQYLETIHNERTRATYRYALLALERMLGDIHERIPCLADVGVETLEQFHHFLLTEYSKATHHTYLAVARHFVTWLDVQDLLPCSISKARYRLQVARGRRRGMPYHHKKIDPELPRIVTYYDEQPLPVGDGWQAQQQRLILLRNRAIVHTLYASGGRVSEVASLTRADVLDGRLSEAQIVAKGGYTHVLLFTHEAMSAIRAYVRARADDHPGLFISHGRSIGKPLGRGSLWLVVKNAAKALDLHESTSPHSFRHYRATQLLNEGMPLESVQAYLGHQDIGTTRKIYAHTRTAVLRDQFETYSQSPREALANLEREAA